MDMSSTTPLRPKLSLCSLPAAKRPDSPEPAIAPLGLQGSVPFTWEEAPGKPRKEAISAKVTDGGQIPGTESARRFLDPPPKLISQELKSATSAYPTTAILDGPYAIFTCYSFSFADEKSAAKLVSRINGGTGGGDGKKGFVKSNHKEKGIRTGRIYKTGVQDRKSDSYSPSCLQVASTSSVDDDDHDQIKAAVPTARITSFRRQESSAQLSKPASHFWASIYGKLKKAVQWKRR